MPWLGCRSFPKFRKQPLLPHEWPQHVQRKPNLNRAHRLSRRPLRRFAQHLQ
jgi:hypothetical protein